jgi:DNA-binding transcriptional LysR family regulator
MKIFKAVVDHGSFRACADAVGISQVVVSSHIRELEKNLGILLFDRRAGHAATLTSKGQRMYSRISAILVDIQDMLDEIGGQTNRRITLVTFSYLFQKYQERLARFQREHPHVELNVTLDPPENAALASQINSGVADIACFFTCGEPPPAGSVAIGETRFGVFVAPDHPLAGMRRVSFDALDEFNSVSLPKARPLRKITDQAWAAISAAPRRAVLETDALPLILDEVRSRHAWVCLFRDSVGESFNLREVDLAVPLPPIAIQLLSRASTRLEPNMQALRNILSEA